ncbi:hypothetical protein ACLNBI_18370 [Pseudomonas guariconensis]|uniref:hypothetical protein n=1 Tax=Pseudomonas guariconensis TaxID=1288410 RepID=UPI0039E8B642
MTADSAKLPAEICSKEILIRALSSDVVKKGKVHWRAFRPPVGNPLTSVMRAMIGLDFCKDKSKSIFTDRYVGMAAVTVSEVLDTEAKVDDAQDEYPGHAHINHIDPPVLANDPNDPTANLKLNNRCKTLADKARVYIDSSPEQEGWKGQNIV